MQKHIKNLLEHNALTIAVLLTILVAYLSLTPNIHIKPPIEISSLDKILHASAYFVLTLSWLFALKNYKNYKFIGVLLLLFGALMEVLQGMLTENRQKDIYDILANTVGIALATIFFSTFYKYFLKYFDK